MDNKLKHKIINYLNKEYSGLFRYEIEKLPNYIFFMKDGKVIYQYDKKNGEVYISYDKIWSFLKSFFGLEYEETQSLTKEWVEKQFKSGVTTTYSNGLWWTTRVEKQFKSGVTTTRIDYVRSFQGVEEQFKMEVTTTLTSQKPQSILAEEQYKLETNE
jgi:hypothetical protein